MAETNTNTTTNTTQTEIKAPEVKSKLGASEEHTIGDVNFKFQFPGVQASIELLDRSKNRFGNIVDSAYYKELMDNVIVEPANLDFDYFDNNDVSISEVMGLADSFLGSKL